MTFPNDTSTPWAVPLMVLGGLLMLAGLALLLVKPKGGKPAGIGGDDAGKSMKDKLIRRARAVRPADKPAPVTPSPVEKQPGSANSSPNVTAPFKTRRAGVPMAALAATIVAGTGGAARAPTPPARWAPWPTGPPASSRVRVGPPRPLPLRRRQPALPPRPKPPTRRCSSM